MVEIRMYMLLWTVCCFPTLTHVFLQGRSWVATFRSRDAPLTSLPQGFGICSVGLICLGSWWCTRRSHRPISTVRIENPDSRTRSSCLFDQWWSSVPGI